MPTTYDEDAKFLKSLGGTPPGSTPSTPARAGKTDIQDEPASEQFRAGLKQGFLGYAEAPAYYAEKGIRQAFPNFRIVPQGVRDWARETRDRAEATTAGRAGELTGTLAPLLLPGIGELGFLGRAAMGGEDLARLARLEEIAQASKAPRIMTAAEKAKLGGRLEFTAPPTTPGTGIAQTLARPVTRAWEGLNPVARGAIKGGVGSVMAQPATTQEQFRDQLLAGALLGGAGAGLRPALREAKFLARRTPPKPPNTVRFYHGGENPTAGGGRWVTPDEKYARNWGAGGKPVHYIDLPIGSPEEKAARMWDELDKGTNMEGRYKSIELPESSAKYLRPYSEVGGKGNFAKTPTPAGRAERMRELQKVTRLLGRRAKRGGRERHSLRDIFLRSLGFFGGHAAGAATGVPGVGWVGGHFLGETLPWLARRGAGGIGDIMRQAELGLTAHPGVYGAAAAPALGALDELGLPEQDIP